MTFTGGDPELVWRHVQRLPGGLPVIPAPVRTDQTRAALANLDAENLQRAAQPERAVVIADCGRLDPGSPAMPIVEVADQALVVARAQTAELIHVASRVPALVRTTRRLGLVLVGCGHASSEVERELGVPVLGTVPEDRQGGAIFTGPPAPRTTWRSRRRMMHSAARIAAQVAAAVPGTPEQDKAGLAEASAANGHGPARGRS